MTENAPAFHLIASGYDPEEVDRRIAELVHATTTAQQHARDLHTKLNEKAAEPAEPVTEGPAEPDFAALGRHVGQLLEAAHKAAADIESDAQEAAAIRRAEADQMYDERADEAARLLAAARSEVAAIGKRRDEIVGELARLRDHLPTVLNGSGAATSTAKA